MAERLERTQAQISKWEDGRALPVTEDVRRVARAYGVQPSRLLPREESAS